MAYVEAHASLREHPKTKKLARLLSISRASAIGHLLCLWWWCQEYADDGDLSAYELDDIAEAADWDGDAAMFVDALLTCGTKNRSGFLVKHADGTLEINDWMEYGGKLSVKRKQARERMRTLRSDAKNVTRTFAEHSLNVGGTFFDVTHIDQTRSDQTRSDKIRQDAVRVTSENTQGAANGANGASLSVCLSDYLPDAAHLLQQHNINTTPHKTKNVAQIIAELGLATVQDAFAIAANKGKEGDWNYVKGIAKRLAHPVNGNGSVNGNGAVLAPGEYPHKNGTLVVEADGRQYVRVNYMPEGYNDEASDD
jgi:hypothetical protein